MASNRPDGFAAFRAHLRHLLVKHALWSRQYVVSALDNSSDAPVAFQQVIESTDLLGQAFTPFVGPDTLKLRKLLRTQEEALSKLVVAIRESDIEDIASARKEWLEKQAEVAELLAKLNPRWPKDGLVKMFHQTSETVLQMIKARKSQDWKADAAALNYLLDHGIRCADVFANGMIATVLNATSRIVLTKPKS